MDAIKKDKLKDILIGNDALKNLINEYNEVYIADNTANNKLELAITIAITMIASIISVFPSWYSLYLVWQITIIIMFFALLVYDIICWVKFIEAKKKAKNRTIEPLNEMIESYVKDNINYTGIIRIAYKANGDFSYLVGNDYFLPHCSLNPDLNLK